MDVSDEIRGRLARLASSRRTRTRVFSPERPCDWESTGITDPRTGVPFTEDGAWQYIADQLEAKVLLQEKALDMPPGKVGYVMKLKSSNATPIYVKLEIVNGKVFGRSFHYDKPPKEQHQQRCGAKTHIEDREND